jgi:MerR family transcriptional regulator, redox-sensitive transcriptional activator SoxR
VPKLRDRSIAIIVVEVGLMSNGDSGPGGSLLSIGAVAELARRRPSTIRYYEQIGLLPQPVRVSGRRRYDAGTVRTLAVIETGQRAGLTLDEIKALLPASPDDRAAIDQLREAAGRKLPEITALIERSELVRSWLECAARCECPDLNDCPLFADPPLMPLPGSHRGHRRRSEPRGQAECRRA